MKAQSVSPAHMKRLTDGCGMLEHALGRIPRRNEGYTTDDNSRALWACIAWIPRVPDDERREWEALADIYTSFLLWAQNRDGSFHNNFAYDRQKEMETSSDDCFGRTFWAAAALWSSGLPDSIRIAAEHMLGAAAARTEQLSFPRGWAYTLAAYAKMLTSDAKPLLEDKQAFAKRLQLQRRFDWLEGNLLHSYEQFSRQGWRWFEPMMSYGNGVLPWSLWLAAQSGSRPESLAVARDSLDFLTERMTAPGGWVRPVGNNGWAGPDHSSIWDQQPLEVMKLALAASEAYRVQRLERDADTVHRCREWFFGANDCGVPMADPSDGSCCDGLTPDGPNQNRGAESTLAYVLTEAIYAEVAELKQLERGTGRASEDRRTVLK